MYGHAALADDRRDDDQMAAALPAEDRQRRARRVIRAEVVDVDRACCICAGGMSSIAPAMPNPALHIITSSRPKRSTARATKRVMSLAARHVGDDAAAPGRQPPRSPPRARRADPRAARRVTTARAVARQAQRGRAADAGRCAGDGDDASHALKTTITRFAASSTGHLASATQSPELPSREACRPT